MFQFRDKTVYIISPERWGTMKVSKHHYALELVKRGNRVYFFEPPDLKAGANIVQSVTDEGVHLVQYKPLARGKRFIGKWLYARLQQMQMKQIINELKYPPDVVWCFDDGVYDDLNIFGAAIRIFHPVDHNLSRKTPACALTADVIFSTSYRILEYMKPVNKPGKVIQHGLNTAFEQFAKKQKLWSVNTGETIRPFNQQVGFWGSLFKESLDRKKIIRLVEAFPSVTFSFWGPYKTQQNNLGGMNEAEVSSFIQQLSAMPNVRLNGPRKANELVKEIENIDLFINIEYEYSARWDNGNPHKILEYLSTGKPVFSTAVVMYAETDLLFVHATEDVVADFQSLLNSWNKWNARAEQLKRIEFALSNTYSKQIDRVEEFVLESKSSFNGLAHNQ